MSTLGNVQYIRGCHYECGGIPCAHRGCSVHRRLNTISTLGEGGISRVHWEMFSTSEGYHDAFGEQLDKSFQFLLKPPMYS